MLTTVIFILHHRNPVSFAPKEKLTPLRTSHKPTVPRKKVSTPDLKGFFPCPWAENPAIMASIKWLIKANLSIIIAHLNISGSGRSMKWVIKFHVSKMIAPLISNVEIILIAWLKIGAIAFHLPIRHSS